MINEINEIIAKLAERGMRCAFVPIGRMDDLKRDFEELYNSGFHTSFLDRSVENKETIMPDGMDFEARSILIAVTPSSAASLEFEYNGNRAAYVIPPTYLELDTVAKAERVFIRSVFEQYGHKSMSSYYFPQKLLAARCGLGAYGRNNIFYSPEHGSYVRLHTYVTDLPLAAEQHTPGGGAEWRPAGRMERCDACLACVDACPVKAIDADRRLVDADRCITALNEMDGEFPDWLDKGSHNCVIGCMKCQDCCPANHMNRDNIIPAASFDEQETREILAQWRKSADGGNKSPYSAGLTAKIEAAKIPEFVMRHLPRNLSALLS